MNSAPVDWNDLIPRCIEGDEKSWRIMVRQATPVLMKVALARLRNREEARDVVQDLFLKLAHDDCRVLRAFDTTLSRRFDAYLRVMARHRCYDLVHRHKESRISEHSVSLEDFGNHLAEESRGERILVHREVREAVKQLSRKQRTAVRLFMWGLKNVEIARAIGIGEDGVASLLWRAREKLRGMAAFRQADRRPQVERKDRSDSHVVSIRRTAATKGSDDESDHAEREERT